MGWPGKGRWGARIAGADRQSDPVVGARVRFAAFHAKFGLTAKPACGLCAVRYSHFANSPRKNLLRIEIPVYYILTTKDPRRFHRARGYVQGGGSRRGSERRSIEPTHHRGAAGLFLWSRSTHIAEGR